MICERMSPSLTVRLRGGSCAVLLSVEGLCVMIQAAVYALCSLMARTASYARCESVTADARQRLSVSWRQRLQTARLTLNVCRDVKRWRQGWRTLEQKIQVRCAMRCEREG